MTELVAVALGAPLMVLAAYVALRLLFEAAREVVATRPARSGRMTRLLWSGRQPQRKADESHAREHLYRPRIGIDTAPIACPVRLDDEKRVA